MKPTQTKAQVTVKPTEELAIAMQRELDIEDPNDEDAEELITAARIKDARP